MVFLYTFLMIFLVALVSPFVVRQKSGWGWFIAVLPATLFVLLLRFVPDISQGDVKVFALNWLPTLDIALKLYIDGLSLFFGLIISFVGVLIIIYATGYFHHDAYVGRFYMIILLFMGAMLGVVLAGNLFTMFVFWELTSFTSYLLIGWKHEEEASRWAALQSLLITGGGGLALFAGLILMRLIVGSFDITDMLAHSEMIQKSSLYLPILILVLLGAFTKSAQFPFHFWLPGAMAAPTPVSAYLHSATMVKAGIYLLARFTPVLGGTNEWHTIVAWFGGLTMAVGAAMALPQYDLKKLLAYTTVSALGMITLLIGIGDVPALKAGMVFLLVHSLYKGALFMIAGGIDHETGTRDTRLLSGLRSFMPITAAAGVLAALSMAGLPPLLGFISKELIYEAKLHAHSGWPWLLIIAGVFANAVNVTVAVRTGMRPFFGIPNEKIGRVHEGSTGLWLGPLVAAAVGLVFGLFPALVSKPIISAAVSTIAAKPLTISLKFWHGFNAPMALSIVTILIGLALCLLQQLFAKASNLFSRFKALYPSILFKKGVKSFISWSAAVTRFIQNGNIHTYLFTIFTVVTFGVWVLIFSSNDLSLSIDAGDIDYLILGIALSMMAATVLAVFTSNRLTAVIALGVVGFGVALIYILYGAPDVAITQLVVETLTVVLFVLVLYRLPRFGEMSSPLKRLRDALLAGSIGVLMAFLVLVKSAGDSSKSISSFFIENSVTAAHGRNIVNVILVDFRGIDTLGEITVLSVAALGVFALLKLKLYTKDK